MISLIAAKLMFIVFTKPNQFTKTYTEAAQIADDWYNKTGEVVAVEQSQHCLLYTSPSPRDQRGSRMPSSA